MTRPTPGARFRAALDSVICQVADVVAAMTAAGVQPASLVADGGMTANTDLMQRQANLTVHGKEYRLGLRTHHHIHHGFVRDHQRPVAQRV